MQSAFIFNFCFLKFDKKFAKNNPNFVFFDFHKPEDIPKEFHDTFDFILIDPPFITLDVWSKVSCKLFKDILFFS